MAGPYGPIPELWRRAPLVPRIAAVASGSQVHRCLRPLRRHFVDAGIVTVDTLPGFPTAIDMATGLRDSAAVELFLAVAVFGFRGIFWTQMLRLSASTWFAIETQHAGD